MKQLEKLIDQLYESKPTMIALNATAGLILTGGGIKILDHAIETISKGDLSDSFFYTSFGLASVIKGTDYLYTTYKLLKKSSK
jgi:hypothetical protein